MGYSPRAALVIALYLLLFSTLDYGSSLMQDASEAAAWRFAAGMSLGLLLAFGVQYVPVVLAANLISGLWIRPGLSFPHLVLQAVVGAAVCGLVATFFSSRVSSPGFRLEKRQDAIRFIGATAAAAVVFSVSAVARQIISGLLHWQDAAAPLDRLAVEHAVGILAVAPMVIVHGPKIIDLIMRRSSRRSPTGQAATAGQSGRYPIFPLSLFLPILAGGVLWLTFEWGIYDDRFIFALLALPLVAIGLARGFLGGSISLLVLAAVAQMTLAHFQAGPEVLSNFEIQLLAAMLIGLLAAAGVGELESIQDTTARSSSILAAVSAADEQFLGKDGWEKGVLAVLKRLGEATDSNRVYILDRMFSGGGSADALTQEWCAGPTGTHSNDQQVLKLLRAQLIEQYATQLSKGESVHCRTGQLPQKQKEILEALGIRSIAIVPMFAEQQWWGCLGLERSLTGTDWPPSDLEALKRAARVFGTLLAGMRVEQQFRQLTGNIQAVFWISSPDGERRVYASPGYAEIWGRSCASLYEHPGSWLEGIYYEDTAGVRSALVKQVWGEYDEEYRVMRPDRSLRWIRDRAYPVRDQSGQVFRIVGIAEDVTKQKEVEEKLRATTLLLSGLIDGLQSGILVEDEDRNVIHVNQAFSSMFGLRVPMESLLGIDSRLLFVKPASLAERIETIIREGRPVAGEQVILEDRIFTRDYLPLCIGEKYRYHLWQYQDITESKRAEEQIKSSLKEKEVLLKEIHHRVKNNLQIVSSLLSLQAGQIEDPAALQTFKESQDRVKAMALIHERLYQSRDFARIDFAGYVRNLTGHLVRSYKINTNTLRLNLEVEAVPINFDVAIPCGLIIHELVSNSLKYAFPDNRGGDIWIRFVGESSRRLRLIVKDNGVGFAHDVDCEEGSSLGLKLVRSLVEQLDGRIAYRHEGGFECDMSFPRTRS